MTIFLQPLHHLDNQGLTIHRRPRPAPWPGLRLPLGRLLGGALVHRPGGSAIWEGGRRLADDECGGTGTMMTRGGMLSMNAVRIRRFRFFIPGLGQHFKIYRSVVSKNEPLQNPDGEGTSWRFVS